MRDWSDKDAFCKHPKVVWLLLWGRGPKNWNSTSMEKKPDLFAHSYCQSCWSTTCWSVFLFGLVFPPRRPAPTVDGITLFVSWCLLAIWSSEQSLSRDNWCASNQSWSNSWKASLSDSTNWESHLLGPLILWCRILWVIEKKKWKKRWKSNDGISDPIKNTIRRYSMDKKIFI